MPFINTKTTVKIDKEKEIAIKEEFGKAIELIKGKSERWLMLNFDGDCSMYFSGSDEDSAIIEVQIFGKASEEEYASLTAKLTEILCKHLPLSPTRVYVKYEEVFNWGYNGVNF